MYHTYGASAGTCAKIHSMLLTWKVMCKEELALHRQLQDLNMGDTESEHNNGQESMDELSTDSENSDTELTIGADISLTDYASD